MAKYCHIFDKALRWHWGWGRLNDIGQLLITDSVLTQIPDSNYYIFFFSLSIIIIKKPKSFQAQVQKYLSFPIKKQPCFIEISQDMFVMLFHFQLALEKNLIHSVHVMRGDESQMNCTSLGIKGSQLRANSSHTQK